MNLKRAGSQPSQKGPAAYFTGNVRLDPLNTAPEPARVSCASVTFEPGARTAWHTHPLGQTLWHGATPTTSMTHIAIQEALDGKAVEWMQHVTDEVYLAGPGSRQ